MKRTGYETRKLKDLRKGDIVRMRIPFEENTTDYYNGYHPKEIRGHMFRDRFGQTSKPRFIIVIGRDDEHVIYLPLTSRHTGYDPQHQYMLQDNSMTWKYDDDMKSYVEIDSMRAVYTNPEWGVQFIGSVMENDMANIMVKLSRHEIDFGSKRDQRAYVSHKKEEAFERKLDENGYILSEKQFEGKTYTREDGCTVTKSRWGLVTYHVPLSKEEVARMVSIREGKPMDEFTRAVTDITEKLGTMESEAM